MIRLPVLYADREEAGQRLASLLVHQPLPDLQKVVVAFSVGGVSVAEPIADALDAPLEILLVDALHAPGHPDLAVGAVAEVDRPHRLVDSVLAAQLGLDERELGTLVSHHRWRFRHDRNRVHALRSLAPLRGRMVVLADDATAPLPCLQLAARVVRGARPRRVVLALPAATGPALDRLGREVDEIVHALSIADHPTPGRLYGDHVLWSRIEIGHRIDRSHDRAAR